MTDTKPPIARFPATKSWAGTQNPVIPDDGEQIIRRATLRGFGIEAHCVTVARFATFVAETGYETDAEKLGWSYVFRGLLSDPDAADVIGGYEKAGWWWAIKGANWRYPSGVEDPAAVQDHPATQISWNDALAFATWAGGRLPTEVEWEHAARGGVEDRRYPWGADEPDDHNLYCNIWQGRFPEQNTCADGYYGTAPVDAFAPNTAGIFNVSGNVWEWTADPFRIASLKSAAKARNVQSKRAGDKVLKGGSFLCHASYCWRYRIAARAGRAPDTGASHTGLRIAYDLHA
ncbi:SUMF1/EgtB/PvdO family nonheme iron enzyme [Tritonibacter mobilis]|uniref:Sulfatase modifying factor 1 (C-alpha-formyglycine-generating enzyme 1) n=1 Tax=Tritonibacter mobilis F1926 TaxID=1265309 RepID=A0A1B1A5C5_9RHOB|nr:SUMF1/EgtB/PvdO family nonheme iron enzyme [Tritonibacter mobilis]ANP41698.1 sulfatase modifying factor 1 (C-alpha-formyglycine- generating enzyme 1) [Tritonibacter mobilis F1926]